MGNGEWKMMKSNEKVENGESLQKQVGINTLILAE